MRCLGKQPPWVLTQTQKQTNPDRVALFPPLRSGVGCEGVLLVFPGLTCAAYFTKMWSGWLIRPLGEQPGSPSAISFKGGRAFSRGSSVSGLALITPVHVLFADVPSAKKSCDGPSRRTWVLEPVFPGGQTQGLIHLPECTRLFVTSGLLHSLFLYAYSPY